MNKYVYIIFLISFFNKIMISILYNKNIEKYEIEATSLLPKEFKNLFNDIVKFSIVIIVSGTMLHCRDDRVTFNSAFEIIINVILGLSLYWLIFDKLFKIT